MQSIHDLKASMDAIDPRLFFLVLSLLAWGAIAIWRKAHAKSFDFVTSKWPVLQAAPAIALTGILSAATGDDAKSALLNAFFGAGSGLAAIGLHHLAKRAVESVKASEPKAEDK